MAFRRQFIARYGPVVIALPLILSAFTKLTLQPNMVHTLNAMGYADKVQIIGVIELITALGYAFPLTRSIGFFFLNAFLGGAIAAEMSSPHPNPLSPLLLLILSWILILYEDARWALRALYRPQNKN